MPTKKLHKWFAEHRRAFPWRDAPTPYQVWISEVMLQQTQAQRVVEYYTRWMEHFPDIAALASADELQVLKLWEGLGYYSRAKNLHKAAKVLIENGSGMLPADTAMLAKLPGLGPYTIAAIQCFAFHQRVIPLDANAIRVLSRWDAVRDDITKQQTRSHLTALGTNLLSKTAPWTTAEAIIELGALCCSKKPQCANCPLKSTCKAHKQNSTDRIPYTSKRVQYEKLERSVALILHDDRILIYRVPSNTIMAGLYEFPSFPFTRHLTTAIREELGLEVTPLRALSPVQHSYTRFRITLHATLFTTTTAVVPPNYLWHSLRDCLALPFSSGMRRLLQQLCGERQLALAQSNPSPIPLAAPYPFPNTLALF